jgi:hypothetical protein
MSTTHIPLTLRRQVYDRAGGCCEYCLIPETAVFAPHEIDHIISQKHGGKTDNENLALSCTLCNKHQGSDLSSVDPDSGDIVPLFHPRRDRWTDHFQLNGAQFVALSAVGRATIRLLQLNHPYRMEERELLLAAAELNIPR